MPRRSSDTGSHARAAADLALRKGVDLAPSVGRSRSIEAVAFDDFAFEPDALDVRGTLLERGRNADGDVLAAASVDWPEMPIAWTALQSRSGADHLGLDEDDDVEVGHARFDRAYVVDTDDTEGFLTRFVPPVLDWLADFDAEHGPLTIIFDSTIDADRRRGPEVPAIFVSRIVADDDEFVATARLAAKLADHLAATLHG